MRRMLHQNLQVKSQTSRKQRRREMRKLQVILVSSSISRSIRKLSQVTVLSSTQRKVRTKNDLTFCRMRLIMRPGSRSSSLQSSARRVTRDCNWPASPTLRKRRAKQKMLHQLHSCLSLPRCVVRLMMISRIKTNCRPSQFLRWSSPLQGRICSTLAVSLTHLIVPQCRHQTSAILYRLTMRQV